MNKISFCITTAGSRVFKTNTCINSIHLTMKGFDYEIIAAGNTSEINADVKVVDLLAAKNGMLGLMRNSAAQQATGNIIVFIDDDILFPPIWGKQFHKIINDNWNALGNKIFSPCGTRFWDRSTIKPHRLVSYNHNKFDSTLYQTGGFIIIRYGAWKSVLWDQTLPIGQKEDVDFSRRIYKAGMVLDFDPNNYIWHWDDKYTQYQDRTVLRRKYPHLNKNITKCKMFISDLDEVLNVSKK